MHFGLHFVNGTDRRLHNRFLWLEYWHLWCLRKMHGLGLLSYDLQFLKKLLWLYIFIILDSFTVGQNKNCFPLFVNGLGIHFYFCHWPFSLFCTHHILITSSWCFLRYHIVLYPRKMNHNGNPWHLTLRTGFHGFDIYKCPV